MLLNPGDVGIVWRGIIGLASWVASSFSLGEKQNGGEGTNYWTLNAVLVLGRPGDVAVRRRVEG
jgi:hypothetical protein